MEDDRLATWATTPGADLRGFCHRLQLGIINRDLNGTCQTTQKPRLTRDTVWGGHHEVAVQTEIDVMVLHPEPHMSLCLAAQRTERVACAATTLARRPGAIQNHLPQQ